MANPYEAPLDAPQPEAPPPRRFGLIGCGCAALVVFGFLAATLLAWNVKLDQPATPVVAPAPTPPIAPAPPTAPQN